MQINLNNFKLTNYSEVMNFGTTCTSGLSIRDLKLDKEKNPIFNDVVTNPKLIYDCLKTDFIHYKTLNGPMNCKDDNIYEFLKMHKLENLKNFIHNEYGIHFLYQDGYNLQDMKDLLEIRTNIFKKKLNENNFLVFIYTHEDSIQYKPCLEKQDENYEYLKLIEEYFIEKYPNLKFKILAFHTNKEYLDTKNIINFKINIDKEYIENDISKNHLRNFLIYRDLITESLKKILL